jgi:hypothetical protein
MYDTQKGGNYQDGPPNAEVGINQFRILDCGFKGDSLKACSTKPTNSSGKPSKMTAGEPRQRRANILKCTLGAVANNGIRRKLKGQKSPILSIRSINVPCTYCLNCSSFNA